MASFNNRKKVPKAKECLRENRMEVKAGDNALRRGLSEVYKSEKVKEEKRTLLKDPNTKQSTLDFIFGKSDVNPLEKN